MLLIYLSYWQKTYPSGRRGLDAPADPTKAATKQPNGQRR